jgi:phosphohistidine phosphatase SixA
MNICVRPLIALIAAGLFASGAVCAETRVDTTLITSMQQGGYILLMRHASSPRQAPTAETANPDNKDLERQLDAGGRDGARAMGNALRAMRIPVGEVLSSPTYRALETVRHAAFGEPLTLPQLGDGGRSMQPAAVEAQASWLRSKIAEPPRASTNTIVVTHQPNIVSALGRQWSDLADGETLIIRPGKQLEVVARVKIEEWAELSRLLD